MGFDSPTHMHPGHYVVLLKFHFNSKRFYYSMVQYALDGNATISIILQRVYSTESTPQSLVTM